MIRVLITDDHTLLTDSLKIVLESFEGFEVVGVAHDGLKACEMCKETRPDVVLMDIKMPVLDGIDSIPRIKGFDPNIKVIILTSLEEIDYILKAFMNGADAYLMKDTPPDRLKVLIQCVHWGYDVMSGEIKGLLESACKRGGAEESAIKYWMPSSKKILRLLNASAKERTTAILLKSLDMPMGR